MDLQDARRYYDASSAKVSDIARQLAFVGVAVVWFFSGGSVDQHGQISVAHDLRWPGALLVVSLLFDLAHATYRAALWGIVGWLREGSGDVKSFDVSKWAVRPVLWFFIMKLGLLGAAYVWLSVYFLWHIN